ncbi:hypothetical protein [Myxococcus sp. CA040A]|uniref:hypothetical protein n=1 Tax=Myxococcus sp. CA040A TaxID=2741738 RepID=UPI00157ABB60|nr:hypothetical protein [Myxococcus sp. CA040A]NTX09047.1 hypothetical protein [Myxococcus sp. CA040A]
MSDKVRQKDHSVLSLHMKAHHYRSPEVILRLKIWREALCLVREILLIIVQTVIPLMVTEPAQDPACQNMRQAGYQQLQTERPPSADACHPLTGGCLGEPE